MEKTFAPLLSVRPEAAPSDERRDPTYCFTAIARIRTEAAIHRTDQNSAGIPVALAMLSASVGTVAANGEERKKTVFRSSRAFSTHCTARKLTRKVATRAEAKRATANNPADISTPATSVNGRPLSEPQVPANISLMTSKIVFSEKKKSEDPTRNRRAATEPPNSTNSHGP